MEQIPGSRTYSTMNFALQLRYVDEPDEPWVAVPDATHLLGYSHAGSFTGSTDKKMTITLDDEEVVMVPFSYFAKAAINSDKPQARAIGDLMLQYLAAGLKINSMPATGPAVASSGSKASTRYGPQPILEVIRQRGMGRQRALREMNALQLDGIPPLATTAEGQLMGSMPVQDVTVVRASAWLKLPLPQLFTSWRQADQRYTGLATILSEDVIKRYVTINMLPDGRIAMQDTAIHHDGSSDTNLFIDSKEIGHATFNPEWSK
jgi:hypothetical protein